MDERELLRTVPLFSELSDADITSLGRLASRRRLLGLSPSEE